MRLLHVVVLIGLAIPCQALCEETHDLPVDEEKILAEMDRIVDESAPVDEKDRDKADKYLRQGIEAHDARRFERAIELYDRAVKLTPANSVLYYEMALSYNMLGDQIKALENIIRMIALNPKSEGAYVLKGTILDDLGYSDAAIATYDRLLAIMPDSYQGLINKGITYARHNEWEKAEETLKRAMEVNPELPSAYFHLATVASGRGFNYEQEEYLKKFVEVGQDDRRLPEVERKLEALRNVDVKIDPDNPYSDIDMMEQMTRGLWRSTKHRELEPDARGYRLTYEEERAIYEELVIPTWRGRKEKDPDAEHPRYDALLHAFDAGYLDVYIYHLRREEFGERGSEWLQANAQRVDAFREWAAEAAVPIPGEDETATATEDEKNVVLLTDVVMAFAEESPLTYEIDDGGEERSARYLETERELFRKRVKVRGDDHIECRKIMKQLDEEAGSADVIPLHIGVFRCFLPDDEEWEASEMRLSRSGLMMRDLGWSPNGSIELADDKILVGVQDWSALLYLLAKATWKNETQLRLRYRGPEEYEPTFLEEYFAVSTAVQGYHNVKKAALEEEDETFEENPLFETLMAVAQEDLIKGYVLFEVLHKLYGISLASLETDQSAAIDRYIRTFVLRRTDRGSREGAAPPE